MTFKNWAKHKKLDTRLLQPQLPICAREIDAVLTHTLALYFPEVATAPGIFFGRTPTLAHIEDSLCEHRSIWLHQALNDPATPDFVFAFVIKHELLHTRIHPREVKGKWSAHPPEFWEEETRIAKVERSAAWEWIFRQFHSAIRRDNEQECMWVNQRRMNELLWNRACSEQDITRLSRSWRRLGRTNLSAPAEETPNRRG